MTYLGMQIMVESLALAAFGFIYQTTNEPLLKDITHHVWPTRPATSPSGSCR